MIRSHGLRNFTPAELVQLIVGSQAQVYLRDPPYYFCMGVWLEPLGLRRIEDVSGEEKMESGILWKDFHEFITRPISESQREAAKIEDPLLKELSLSNIAARRRTEEEKKLQNECPDDQFLCVFGGDDHLKGPWRHLQSLRGNPDGIYDRKITRRNDVSEIVRLKPIKYGWSMCCEPRDEDKCQEIIDNLVNRTSTYII